MIHKEKKNSKSASLKLNMSVLHTAPLREQKHRPPTGTARAREGLWPKSTKDSGEKSPLKRGWEVGAGRRPAAAGGARVLGEAGRGLGTLPRTRQRGGDKRHRPQRARAQSWGDGSPGPRPTGRPAALEDGLGFSGEAEQTHQNLVRPSRSSVLLQRAEDVTAPQHPAHGRFSVTTPTGRQPAALR